MLGASFLESLMPLSDGAYVPALRWRQAEYQALLRLKEPVKRRVVPQITIVPGCSTSSPMNIRKRE